MAQQELTTVLTVKIGGTERVLKTLGDAEKAAADLTAEIQKTQKGTKEYVRLNQQLEEVNEQLSAAGQNAKKSQGIFGKFRGAVGSVTKGFNGLRVAIAATGIGSLIQIVERLIAFFSQFDEVQQIVNRGMTALNVVFRKGFEILKALGGVVVAFLTNIKELPSALSKVGNEFSSLADDIVKADKAQQALNQVEREQVRLSVEIAELARKKEVAIKQADDTTRSYAARIESVNEAEEASLQIADKSLALQRKRVAALQTLTQEASNSLEKQQELADAEVKLQELEQQRDAFLAEANAKRRAIDDERIGKLLEIRATETESFILQRDQQQAALQAQADFQQALLADRTDANAELERIEIERNLARESARLADEKAERIFQDKLFALSLQRGVDRAKLEAEFTEARAVERQAALDAELAQERVFGQRRIVVAREQLRLRLEAERGLRQVELDEASRLAEEEANNLRLPIEQRLEALLRLRAVELERIESARAAALSERNLTREQIDLINAQADASIAALDRSADATERELVRMQGSLIARLFGVGSEEEIARTREALATLAQFGQDVLGSVLQGIAARNIMALEAQANAFAEQVALAEQASAESLGRVQALQDSLATADVSQRKRIIALIKDEQAAQRKADAEAEAARRKEREAKNRIAKAQRNADLTQAIVNGALAITQALASTPFPLTFAQVAAVVAANAAPVAAIASQPLPTFASGGFTGVDSTGQMPAGVVHTDEYVVPRPVLRLPQARGVVNYLESLRDKSFAQGGPTSGGEATNTPAAFGVMPPTQVEVVLTEVASGLTRLALAESKARL